MSFNPINATAGLRSVDNSRNNAPSNPAAPQPSAGLSGVPDSLESNNPESSTTNSQPPAAERQGFFKQISAWVSQVVQSVFDCLRRWFGRSSAVETDGGQVQNVPEPVLPQEAYADPEILTMIYNAFTSDPSSPIYNAFTLDPSSPASRTPPNNVTIEYLVDQFSRIRSPLVRMQAFEAVLNAANGSDEIARQFYTALPDGAENVLGATKTAFRYCIWWVNGDDAGLGSEFGNRVVQEQPRGALARQAAAALRQNIEANMPSPRTRGSAPSGTPGAPTTARPPGATATATARPPGVTGATA